MKRALWVVLAAGALGCENAGQSPVIEHPDPVSIAPAGPVSARPQAPLTATARVEMLPAGTSRIGEVSAVHLVLRLDGIEGSVPVSVELVSPRGIVFQRLTKTLGVGDSSREAVFDIPVSGTAIEAGLMSGSWTARFSTQGAALATQQFELEP